MFVFYNIIFLVKLQIMITSLHKIKSTLLLLVLITTVTVSAQNTLETANKQFELQAYDMAITSYQELLVQNPDCLECQLKIADSYRILNKSSKAKLAYEKAMLSGALKGQYLLGYGHTLKTLKLYDEAKAIYMEFSYSNPVVGAYFAKSCDAARSYVDGEAQYTSSPFGYNTILSDKALTYHNGQLIISSYEASRFKNHTKEWLKSEGNLLTVDVKNFKAPVRLKSDFNSSGNVNSITYAGDNSICVLSKTSNSTLIAPVFDGEDTKSLYISTEISEDGYFKNEVAFTHNETGASSTHPSLSIDGKTLYFSSNRQGGYGGFDLYKSELVNGVWSVPVNLGAMVNTGGNEITPSVAFNGELYFASDYLIGIGGYDIFQTNNSNGEWAKPTNLGPNVNTSSDDYMPVLDFSGYLKYVTSNRTGTSGGSDIYELTRISGIDSYAKVELSEPVSIEDELQEVSPMESEPIFVMNEDVDFEIREIEPMEGLEVEEHYVIDENVMPKAFVIPEYKSSVRDRDPNLKTVSLNDRVKIPANAFFVQIASISKYNNNFSVYQKASTLGNVYKMYKDGTVKIRVGYYGNREDAKKILTQLKQNGFSDAFITHDVLNVGEIELIYSTFDNNYSVPDVATTKVEETYSTVNNASNYKVRLAAYDNPLFFDVAAVKGIAKLEQWSKGDWTIFLLGGFHSLEDAEKAKIKAINRGFIDAYIVVDNGGVLEKLIKN